MYNIILCNPTVGNALQKIFDCNTPCAAHKKRAGLLTYSFMVIECMAEVRATPENTLKILHFYGIDARVYYEKVIRLCIAQGRICLLVIRYSEIVQILLKSVLCR